MLKRLFSFLIFLSLLFTGIPLGNASDEADETCAPPQNEKVYEDLALSALYPNPNTGEEEWIEIQNTGTKDADLSDYTLEDSTAKPWTPSGTLEAGEKIRINGFSFQLNNSDETVTFKTQNGAVLDTWTYSTTTKGEILTHETTSTSNSESETKNNATEPTTIAESSTEVATTPNLWPLFSEALPNPEGSDSTDEWIELYNPYEETLNLSGLKLDDMEGGSSPYSLSGTLAPETYLIVSVSETGLTLNNDGDQVRLLGVTNEILWEVTYSNPNEGESYALLDSDLAWTSNPTPGEENQAGSSETTEASETGNSYQDGDLSEEVELTEVYPNPEGPDNEEEWIELTNGGGTAVNLGNWTLTDASGKTYTFPDETVLEAGATLVIYRTTSEISLNNSNESLALADFTGEILSEVAYETSQEDQSYAQIEVESVESTQASLVTLGNSIQILWEWVIPTPGEENPIWKQIKGTVTEYDGTLLTLFDGLSNWTFTVPSDATAPLLFSPGNMLLVNASLQNGLYQIMQAELLETAPTQDVKDFPWFFILSTLGVLSWLSYELYKKHKKTLNFDQMALN